MLGMLHGDPGDFVLNTNDDNYYVPKFVEFMMKEAAVKSTAIVYCDFLHHNADYDKIESHLKTNFIDMGAFITDLALAQEIGFPYMIPAHDGKFAEEADAICKQRGLRTAHIFKTLFIHN
jgi:hypothetical protein